MPCIIETSMSNLALSLDGRGGADDVAETVASGAAGAEGAGADGAGVDVEAATVRCLGGNRASRVRQTPCQCPLR